MAVPAAAEGSELEQSLLSMRGLDQRVAAIGHRLATANAELCRERQWLPGFALHELSQYSGAFRDAAIRAFRLGEGPAVLALVPGSPAERAGLRLDDTLLRLDGRDFPRAAAGASGTFTRMEQILDAVEQAFADGNARVEVQRNGGPVSIDIAGEQGCATRFQLLPSRRLNALADGRYVQVTTAIGNYVRDDAELAAVLAHEFAHNVLRHRARLDAAGVARGFFGNFGGNARRIRETEVEADRLSIYLLEKAGFDPEGAVRFWSRFGPRGLNFLGSSTHPNWRRRIAFFRAEIEALARARAVGAAAVPPFALPVPAAAQ